MYVCHWRTLRNGTLELEAHVMNFKNMKASFTDHRYSGILSILLRNNKTKNKKMGAQKAVFLCQVIEKDTFS